MVVIFYSQMQELRTTFFWLLIASHLALFKRILQTTYMYYSSTYITSHCWLNSVFKIKLALFNFKILAQIKFSFVEASSSSSVSFIPTKTPQSFTLTVVCHSNDDTKALKMAEFQSFFCFVLLLTLHSMYTYSKVTILQLDVIRD